ncbi:B12-binding domain-containing radical SAM protein [Candidatus Pacearchaeota archaeon]|nr:B12-binding domain-containing radical SAM protein [Candidatus Pacearchaeota archaeon]
MKNLKGLLIYPPAQLMKQERARPDGSLGLIYLASSLESKGIETDILDASVGVAEHNIQNTFYNPIKQENGLVRIGMEFEDIANYIKKKNYNFVGINSNLTPQTRMAFETAKAIKQLNPKIPIYAGGVNARALNKRFLETGHFDAICLTEGEIIFPRAIIEGVENVSGFAYKDKNGKIKVNQVDETCFPENLDDLPIPAWEKLPLDKYGQIASPHGVDVTGKSNHRYAPIMTSRGCVWHCTFCHISTEKENIGKLRTHSIERVLEEMNGLKSLGIEKLFFEDDTLLTRKKRAKEIFSKAREKEFLIANVNGVNLIDFYNKKDWSIDIEYLEILKQAGYEQIVFPAESGSQRILDKYASGKVKLEKMDLPVLMKTMVNMGIKAPVNMIIGFPDETEEEIQKTIDLGKKLKENGAPYVSFFLPIPFPGSKLYDIAIKGNYLNRDFNPDMMNWKRAIMTNTFVPPKRLEEIRDYANELVNDKDFIKRAVQNTIGYKL